MCRLTKEIDEEFEEEKQKLLEREKEKEEQLLGKFFYNGGLYKCCEKDLCESSVKCNMSAEMSRVAAQTVWKNLYDHNYFLSKDKAIERDPSLSEYKQDNPSSNKRQKRDLPKKQAAESLNEYKPYENILPLAKTINDYKLTLAIQTEKEAATALDSAE